MPSPDPEKRQKPKVPQRQAGESIMDYNYRLRRWYREEPRSKGDLKEWASCYPMHLDRMPPTSGRTS